MRLKSRQGKDKNRGMLPCQRKGKSCGKLAAKTRTGSGLSNGQGDGKVGLAHKAKTCFCPVIQVGNRSQPASSDRQDGAIHAQAWIFEFEKMRTEKGYNRGMQSALACQA